jgi:hypothetical protein
MFGHRGRKHQLFRREVWENPLSRKNRKSGKNEQTPNLISMAMDDKVQGIEVKLSISPLYDVVLIAIVSANLERAGYDSFERPRSPAFDGAFGRHENDAK